MHVTMTFPNVCPLPDFTEVGWSSVQSQLYHRDSQHYAEGECLRKNML